MEPRKKHNAAFVVSGGGRGRVLVSGVARGYVLISKADAVTVGGSHDAVMRAGRSSAVIPSRARGA